jgi:hypothetical protein
MTCSIVLLGALAACSSVQVRYPDGRTARQSREEFARYVEQVFRYHNSVANNLIIAASLIEDGEIEAGGAWERAEEEMTDACRPLIEAVNAQMEGEPIGFFQKLQLPTAVPACEAASRRLEAMLPPDLM